MSDILQTPPISGGKLPLKELKAEKTPKTGDKASLNKNKKSKNKIYFLFALLLIIFFTVGIGLGFYLKQKNDKQKQPLPSPSVEPSPSPTVLPSPSFKPEGLQGRIDQFEEKIRETDLKEQELSPPALDFEIRFEIKE